MGRARYICVQVVRVRSPRVTDAAGIGYAGERCVWGRLKAISYRSKASIFRGENPFTTSSLECHKPKIALLLSGKREGVFLH
jgi:hypothetical protein